MTEHALTVPPDAAGQRLDQWLAGALPEISRSRIQAMIRGGHLSLDGRVITQPSLKLAPGQALHLVEPEAVDLTLRPESIPLDIVYEDEHLLVIDKPAGLVVHPGAGHAEGTLINALLAHCGDSLSGIGGVRRPGIVHRLDKDTSGLLVVAKNDRAHQGLSEQFADHGRTGPLERSYLALVWGRPRRDHGTIVTGIDRSSRNREKMAVVADGRGREAITHYEVLRSYPDTSPGARQPAPEPVASLVRCTLETGRTHQIRVHMAHIGHPLLGDSVYGSGFRTKAGRLPEAARAALDALGRQALHAEVLGFAHPITGEPLSFRREPPKDFAGMQDNLEEM